MFLRNIFGAVFVSVFAFASNASAGKVELTTYYPAPYGEYNQLQSKGSCVGTTCATADVTDNNLKIKGALGVETNATVTGVTHASGGLVIPTSRKNSGDGSMWIE